MENDKKAREGRKKAEAKKDCIAAAEVRGATIVRKGGKDARTKKEKADAIKANLDLQTQSKPGTVRRIIMTSGHFAGSTWVKTSVDADTTVNNVNKDNKSDYFHLVINGILKPLDCIASDGTIRKCVSFAKHYINIVRSSTSSDTFPVTNDDEIVPDSGVTSHTRIYIYISVFENNYVACTDVLVLIGDGTKIPVLGYGTF